MRSLKSSLDAKRNILFGMLRKHLVDACDGKTDKSDHIPDIHA
nr:MAG: hypothetical protein BECKTC1821D_GA0114238_10206 [Candidatus Kentron sp. TC]VFK58475.1 MAG: hypothetical protein BECKTC1821F_GA0114240_102432 [Candidatus Kentron sp. TC]